MITNFRKKVLVVDDSGLLLWNVKSLLEDEYEVSVAVSGEFAIKQIVKSEPDIILLDYEMPEMNGAETYAAIRRLPKGEKIPIIFLTGADDSDTIDEILNLNPLGFILKPVNKDLLKAAIKKILG